MRSALFFSRLLMVFCFVLEATGLWAQLPGLRVFSRTDGFNATVGYNLYQDPQGFIWIGTDNGAVRFDGNSFKTFGRKDGLTDLDVMDCIPYGDGDVLISPVLNNLACYSKGRIVNSRQNKMLGAIRHASRNRIFFDSRNRAVWVTDGAASDTLYRFSSSGIEKIVCDSRLAVEYISGYKMIARDSYFFSYILDLKKHTFVRCKYIGASSVAPHWMDARVITPDGRHLICFRWKEQAFYIFEFNDNYELVYRERKLADKYISKDCLFRMDNKGDLWVTIPRGGVYYMEDILSAGKIKKTHYFLKGYSVNDVFRDAGNGIWMTTKNGCLLYLSDTHFRSALRVSGLGLPDYIPKFICGRPSDSSLFLSYSNVDLVSLVFRGKTTTFRLNDGFSEGARYLLSIRDREYLVLGNSVAYINPYTSAISFGKISCAAKDACLYNDSTLLVARSFDAKGYHIPRRPPGILPPQMDEPGGHMFYFGRSMALAAMPDKRLLIGTPNGLFIADSLYGKTTRLLHPVLTGANITDICNWGNNKALIGTNALGFFLYDNDNKSVTAIGAHTDLASCSVHNIFVQNDSICWLATEQGAVRLNLDHSGKIRSYHNYDYYDGLPSDNVTSVTVLADTAYITTIEGMGILSLPESSQRKPASPRIVIDLLRLSDTVFYQPRGSVLLSAKQNDLLFNLSPIAYESMGNVDFFYKLEGLNNEWIMTTNPEIRFPALRPGHYKFYVYAVNAAGIRSAHILKLELNIQPAFWQTFYFKAGVVLLALLALFLLLRFLIVKKERGRHEKQMQKRYLAELELEAIKAQINPHFIYNCLNSIQYLHYKHDHVQAEKYIDLFSNLIRMTMAHAQQSFITIEEEIHYLEYYLRLEKLRLKERLRYDIRVDERVDREGKIPAMLLQPYVENALKHGIAPKQQGGLLTISFGVCEDGLEIKIEDDGPGLSGREKSRGASLGLRLSGTRAESYNRLFGLEIGVRFIEKQKTGNGSGIIVIIHIPPKTS